MVCSTLSFPETLGVFLGVLAVCSCTSKNESLVPAPELTAAALARVESVESPAPGSPLESEALSLFRSFYEVYSTEAIRSGVRDLYAPDAWFGDPFHTVEGIDAIEHYFLKMAEPVESCSFVVDAIDRSGKDYYARWTMKLVSKVAKGKPIEVIGISHVRFNEHGKVIFQQDYWDTSAMFDRLPVAGFWTRLIKGRIMKGLEQ